MEIDYEELIQSKWVKTLNMKVIGGNRNLLEVQHKLWGCTSKTSVQFIQTQQKMTISGIINAHRFIRNEDM